MLNSNLILKVCYFFGFLILFQGATINILTNISVLFDVVWETLLNIFMEFFTVSLFNNVRFVSIN